MSSIHKCGDRVVKLREKLQLTQEDFARRAGCPVEVLLALESGGWSHPQAIFPTLERIAAMGGVTTDVLLFADTNLFQVRINELRMEALRVIVEKKLTDSVEVLTDVMDAIEHEYESVMIGEESALAYRKRLAATEMDEDRVRDLVLKSKRKLNIK